MKFSQGIAILCLLAATQQGAQARIGSVARGVNHRALDGSATSSAPSTAPSVTSPSALSSSFPSLSPTAQQCPQNADAFEFLTKLAQDPEDVPNTMNWTVPDLNHYSKTDRAALLQEAQDCATTAYPKYADLMTPDVIELLFTRRNATTPSSVELYPPKGVGSVDGCLAASSGLVLSLMNMAIGALLGVNDVDPEATNAIAEDITKYAIAAGAQDAITAVASDT
ncbi:MAG: hypothetical protein SGILL_009385, partial [Bacillariaceae sp.]